MYDMEYDGRKLYHISLSINNQTNCMGGKGKKDEEKKKLKREKDQFVANLLIQTHCFLMIINLLSHHHSILKAMINMGVIIPHSVGLPLMEKLRRGSCFRLPKSQWRKLCA